MSDNTNLKLSGFIEYLSLLSDMLSRMKNISEKYGIDPSKLKEDNTLDELFTNSDPMIVGLLIKTIMKFRKILDKPMENLDTLDSNIISEFKSTVEELRQKSMEVKS